VSTESEEYDHDPDRFPLAEEGSDEVDSGHSDGDDGGGDEFDTRGWVLVAVVLVSFFVAPLAILFRPPSVPFEVAFLVLPLLPGFLLGGAAVWALAGRRGD
jgi:hypothetical protein